MKTAFVFKLKNTITASGHSLSAPQHLIPCEYLQHCWVLFGEYSSQLLRVWGWKWHIDVQNLIHVCAWFPADIPLKVDFKGPIENKTKAVKRRVSRFTFSSATFSPFCDFKLRNDRELDQQRQRWGFSLCGLQPVQLSLRQECGSSHRSRRKPNFYASDGARKRWKSRIKN